MEQINKYNKPLIDRWINEHYQRLADKFGLFDRKLDGKGISALDKLNDTILNLYLRAETFEDYAEAKAFINNKFTPRAFRVFETKAKASPIEADEAVDEPDEMDAINLIERIDDLQKQYDEPAEEADL